ncbi:hypothetical protein [Rhizobium sp. Root1204]|uniref:hypothetical protein n=1 Tax=Rhizobium sp. Root1204 TaxID=1736428 RepID=UPI000AAEB3AC|nr:hypothetical protein [Rhizobium sp. Root1204]
MALKAKVQGRAAVTRNLNAFVPNALKYAAEANLKVVQEVAEKISAVAPTGATLEYMEGFSGDFLKNHPARTPPRTRTPPASLLLGPGDFWSGALRRIALRQAAEQWRAGRQHPPIRLVCTPARRRNHIFGRRGMPFGRQPSKSRRLPLQRPSENLTGSKRYGESRTRASGGHLATFESRRDSDAACKWRL